jgi:hypothetical protein
MMYRATSLRNAALAMTFAVAMSLPVTLAHAAGTKPFNPVEEGCKGANYIWSDTLGCANKSCRYWLYGVGRPGAVVRDDFHPDGGNGHFVACNGFTGRWEPV